MSCLLLLSIGFSAAESQPDAETRLKTAGLDNKISYLSQASNSTQAVINYPLSAVQNSILQYLGDREIGIESQSPTTDGGVSITSQHFSKHIGIAFLKPHEIRGSFVFNLKAKDDQTTLLTIQLNLQYYQVVESTSGDVFQTGAWKPYAASLYQEKIKNIYRQELSEIVLILSSGQ